MEMEVKISKERWKEIRQEERETNRDNSAEYHIGFINGAVWSDVTILDKVCEWIEQHLYDDEYVSRDNEGTWVDAKSLTVGLKKAIEEKL